MRERDHETPVPTGPITWAEYRRLPVSLRWERVTLTHKGTVEDAEARIHARPHLQHDVLVRCHGGRVVAAAVAPLGIRRRDAWAPIFVGRLRARDDGTELRGVVRPQGPAYLILATLIATPFVALQLSASGWRWPLFWLGLAMLLFSTGLGWFDRRSNAHRRAKIIQEIERALGRPADPAVAAAQHGREVRSQRRASIGLLAAAAVLMAISATAYLPYRGAVAYVMKPAPPDEPVIACDRPEPCAMDFRLECESQPLNADGSPVTPPRMCGGTVPALTCTLDTRMSDFCQRGLRKVHGWSERGFILWPDPVTAANRFAPFMMLGFVVGSAAGVQLFRLRRRTIPSSPSSI